MDLSVIQKQSFEFALTTIRLYKKLQARQEFILSSQLLKSGTSIGVSVEEAATGVDGSASDKLRMAAKDARETRYWLRLLQESHLVDLDVSAELAALDELIHLLQTNLPLSTQLETSSEYSPHPDHPS
ncbi:MAG: four helix bundle protein [Synechococcales cyanobacterium M58_A2018_015]|nr:four helix bundle protein [Synechococcales cyanobacterium M58_A2018_015]